MLLLILKLFCILYWFYEVVCCCSGFPNTFVLIIDMIFRRCSTRLLCFLFFKPIIFRKNSEPMTGFEPTTFRTPGGRSIHWATRTLRTARSFVMFLYCLVNRLKLSQTSTDTSWLNDCRFFCFWFVIPSWISLYASCTEF